MLIPKSRLKHGLSTNVGSIRSHNVQLKGVDGLLSNIQQWKHFSSSQNLGSIQDFMRIIVVHGSRIHVLENTVGVRRCKIGNEEDVEVVHRGIRERDVTRTGNPLVRVRIQRIPLH